MALCARIGRAVVAPFEPSAETAAELCCRIRFRIEFENCLPALTIPH